MHYDRATIMSMLTEFFCSKRDITDIQVSDDLIDASLAEDLAIRYSRYCYYSRRDGKYFFCTNKYWNEDNPNSWINEWGYLELRG